MELDKALSQISEIHGHLAKSEVYRSGKSAPVAVSGLIAVMAAVLQPSVLSGTGARPFVIFWLMVATISLLMGGGVIVYNYAFCEGAFQRRTTRKVVWQFAPSLMAGALVTAAVLLMGHKEIRLLPGLWALFFSLGVFAARPYLPRAVGWVALFYLCAGAVLLLLVRDGSSLSPWGMGVTFGVGQLLAALVLYWNLEREEDG